MASLAQSGTRTYFGGHWGKNTTRAQELKLGFEVWIVTTRGDATLSLALHARISRFLTGAAQLPTPPFILPWQRGGRPGACVRW